MSKEPSMEEILSSIKRIIAEDSGEAPAPAARAPRRGGRVARDADFDEEPAKPAAKAPAPSFDLPADDMGFDDEADEDEGILELTDEADFTPPPAQAPVAQPAPAPRAADRRVPPPRAAAPAPASPPAAEAADTDAMLSLASEVATRQALSSLSHLLVKPADPQADNTLEGLVREMLRPMLKEWLDSNLPQLVETLVAREISRISGRG